MYDLSSQNHRNPPRQSSSPQGSRARMATSAFSGNSLSLAAAAAASTTRPVGVSALPLRNPNNPGCSTRCAAATRTVSIARAPKRFALPRAGSNPEATDSKDDGHAGLESSGDTSYASLNMQGLVQLYKEAIVSGNEKGITDLEAAIFNVERGKNELLNKVAELEAEIASGKGKFLRLNADFENFRKRSDIDRLRSTSDIQGETVESLLPLVDNFEKAKRQAVPETEKEKKIVTSYQGIYKQFVEVMRALRVSVVETVGKQFDPSVHEAVGRVDSHQFKAGTVLHEVQRGFLLGDAVLRPAKVKVSSGPSSKTEDVPDGDGDEKTAEKSNAAAESEGEEVPVAEGS